MSARIPLAVLLAAMLAGCAGMPVEPGPAAAPMRTLAPLSTLQGARLAAGVDLTGQPDLKRPLGFLTFVSPTALAAVGNDLYVADIGRQKLYRVDLGSRVMSELPVRGIRPGMRIRVASDRSVYVLDPAAATIERYARGGQRLTVYADRFSLPQPLDFVIDERRARLVASDRSYQQLVAFHPGGGASYALPWPQQDRTRVLSLGVMALGDDVLHLADPACACLHRYAPDSGRVGTYAEGRVRDPRGMAVDRYGTLYVIDDGGASLKVFRGEELIETVPAHRLGLASLAAIAADETRLYLADGAAGRIAMFNILPVFRGRP